MSSTRILVIDNAPAELAFLGGVLQKGGSFEMHGVNHGDAAFEHLETSPRLPDLILLGYDMPGIPGLEILAGIKSDLRWSHIPVILMSGTGGEGEEQGLSMGAADFVLRPIQPSSLVLRIRNQMERTRERQRVESIAQETAQAGANALRIVADNILSNIDGIQGHWDEFLRKTASHAEFCSTEMREELPLLLHDLRNDVTRLVRIAEEMA